MMKIKIAQTKNITKHNKSSKIFEAKNYFFTQMLLILRQLRGVSEGNCMPEKRRFYVIPFRSLNFFYFQSFCMKLKGGNNSIMFLSLNNTVSIYKI